MSLPQPTRLPIALAEIPAGDWAAAIVSRRSTRSFDGRPVDQTVFQRLRDFISGLPQSSTCRVVFLESSPAEVFTGLVGSYGRISGALSSLVLIGASSDPAVQESAGYLMEAAVLEATSLGIDTCWVGGFFNRQLASSLMDLTGDDIVMAVSPLGYRRERQRSAERLLKKMIKAHTRRPIEEIAPGFDEDRWPAWAAEGARLARVAPSAVNRQPWSIGLWPENAVDSSAEEACGVVFSTVKRGTEGGISRRLDCGIAMLHFEVGARLMEASGHWELLAEPQVGLYVLDEPAGLAQRDKEGY